MLTYTEILDYITLELSNNFDIDIFTDNILGVFENECFNVSLILNGNELANVNTFTKDLIISIKYFNGDRLGCYKVANELENRFIKYIKVKENKILNISKTEPNIINDNVGDFLDFLVYVNYFDKIVVNEQFESMEEININNEVK